MTSACRKIRRRVPVEEYLRPQTRFAHLFGDHAAHRRASRASRPIADRNIRRFGLLAEEDDVMDKPFAITLDVGSSLANKTGSWRTERPVYVDRLPPCNDACPAGEDIQGWLYHAEERRLRARLARSSWRTTRSRRSWAGSATTRARPRATARQLDEAVGINSVERFLGDEAIKQGWRVAGRPRRRPASACWSSAPARPGCRPPTTCAASATP